MSANDAFGKALSDDKILGGLWKGISGWESDEQKKAEADQAQALQNSKDQLQFDKGVYSNNQATVDHTLGQIFGNDGPSAFDQGQAAPATPAAGAPQAAQSGGYDPRMDPNSGQYDYQYALQHYDGSNSSAPASAASAPAPTASSPTTAPNTAARFGLTAAPKTATATQPYAKYTKTGNFFDGPTTSGADTAAKLGWGSQLRTPDAPWSLPGEYDKAAKIQGQVFDQLRGTLNGITDPELAKQVADVQSEVELSPEAKAARSDALNQLKGYTDVKETAQERLMREVARREMEGQMKGQRDAMAANLKSRGVYGSGAEVASQLQTQQEAASRRALEELSAQANAQNRAMQALGKYGDLGIQAGNQDIAIGGAHDAAHEYNNMVTEQHSQADLKAKQDANKAKTARATTLADAGNNVATGVERRAGNLTNTLLAGAGLKTGVATQGANLVNGGYATLNHGLGQDAGTQQAKDDTGTGISPF